MQFITDSFRRYNNLYRQKPSVMNCMRYRVTIEQLFQNHSLQHAMPLIGAIEQIFHRCNWTHLLPASISLHRRAQTLDTTTVGDCELIRWIDVQNIPGQWTLGEQHQRIPLTGEHNLQEQFLRQASRVSACYFQGHFIRLRRGEILTWIYKYCNNNKQDEVF